MNVKTLLAALRGVTAYKDVLNQPVMECALRLAACAAQGKTLEELRLEELQEVSGLFEQDVYEALKLENCMALRSSYGGPAVSETSRQIEEIEAFVAARQNGEG